MSMYTPHPENQFVFGLWTVGNPGRDPFGLPTRDSLTPANDTKSASLVEAHARRILGKDGRLERPSAVAFGRVDQRQEELSAHATPARVLGDVQAHFGDSSVHRPRRHVPQRGPSGHRVCVVARDNATRLKMRRVPRIPRRRLRLKGRLAGRDPGFVDVANGRPIVGGHGVDSHDRVSRASGAEE